MVKNRKTPGSQSAPGTGTSIGTGTSPGKSKNTTTTDKMFGNRLWANGVRCIDPYAQPPNDLATVKQYLEKDRNSPTANEDDFESYRIRIAHADNENTVTANTWHYLAKDHYLAMGRGNWDVGYDQNSGFQWTEVESAITANLSDPKPDISESFRHYQYPPDAVEALGPALAPTLYGAAMPRLCLELKGPDGMMISAHKQAAYDGAVMVEAAWQAHQFMSKPENDFIGKTQALTGAFNGSYLHIYTNHAIALQAKAIDNKAANYPESLQYHQYPLETVLPGASLEDFQNARKIVRNTQDWAREKAIEIKDALHTHVDAMHAATATTTTAVPFPADKLTHPPPSRSIAGRK